jgi:hypothetical protein
MLSSDKLLSALESEIPTVEAANIPDKYKSTLLLLRLLSKRDLPDIALDKTARVESIVEFIREKQPSSHVDKLLVVAYYLEGFKGYQNFTIQDIQSAFTQARLSLSSNTAAFISECVRQGLLLELDSKKDGLKAYRLTISGIDRVEKGRLSK